MDHFGVLFRERDEFETNKEETSFATYGDIVVASRQYPSVFSYLRARIPTPEVLPSELGKHR